ncbi:MAG: hypothetical protein CVV60_02515 [Tenericutes bacterium HGW-Tenericutes-5]|nr:MAG: hypothetical protein CVV60_02515 [Tenericutes bacterium HGW-Tenericutes-5]
MDIIEKEFIENAIRRNNLFLYNKEDALAVIERCKQLNIWILGIDSFVIRGDYIIPFLEYSSDYSDLGKNNNVWKVASNFIADMIKKNSELVFEIV